MKSPGRMLLCKMIVPAKLCFALPQSNKRLIGVIHHAYHKYHAGMQHITYKHCFDSSLRPTDACNAVSQVYKIAAATFTTSTQLCVKMFVENENNFAHNVMEMLPTYNVTSSLMRSKHIPEARFSLETYRSLEPKNWTLASPDTVCKAFENISKYVAHTNVSISHEVFKEMCSSIVTKLPQFHTSDLYMVMSLLTMWQLTPSAQEPNFRFVWEALDKECERRVEQWDVETLLQFADLWYMLRLSTFSNYMKKCIEVLNHECSKLSPSQLVQSLFYVRTSQKQELVSMHEFENCITMCSDKLSLNELAIVAMSFFKTKTKLTGKYLLGHILTQITDEVNTVHEIALAAVLKITRYSANVGYKDQLYALLDKLVPKVHTLSLLACVQIAMSASGMQIFHEELMKAISHRCVSNVGALRLKDMATILFALTSLDYNPETTPCIYEQIVKELHDHRRDKEIKKYPHCLAESLSYLTHVNIYSNELSNKVLDPQFILNADKNSWKRIMSSIFVLDTSLAIDCPNYYGNHLSRELRHQFYREVRKDVLGLTDIRTKMGYNMACVVKCARIMEHILGDSGYIYLGHILPNFDRPDIVFGLIKGNDPIQIPANFRTLPLETVKRPPKQNNSVEWYCLVFGSQYNYSQPCSRPMAMLTAKIRQLRAVGYTPIIVPFYEWPKDTIDQKQYLEEKVRFQSKQ